MKPAGRLAAVCAVVSFGAFLSASVASLHAQAQQRGMFVSVVDKQGKPVENIGPTDLTIREDNVAREVLRVQPATDPIQIALMVDTSQAADPYIDFASFDRDRGGGISRDDGPYDRTAAGLPDRRHLPGGVGTAVHHDARRPGCRRHQGGTHRGW